MSRGATSGAYPRRGSPAAVTHLAACWRSDEIEHDEPAPAEVFGVEAPAEDSRAPGGQRSGLPRVLDVVDLVKHYPVTTGTIFKRQVGTVHAVDGVSFDIRQGEALGLVGESGCGKTTTLMEILGLEAPMGGRIEVLGSDVATLDGRARTAIRRDMQIVFQDPVASLDPRLPVADIIGEPLEVHGVARPEIRRRVAELLDMVGLRPTTRTATPPSSPAVNASGSGSPGRSRSNRSCSSSTNRSPRSTSPFRPGSSTCSRSCAAGSGSRSCSSPTTCRSSGTSQIGSP